MKLERFSLAQLEDGKNIIILLAFQLDVLFTLGVTVTRASSLNSGKISSYRLRVGPKSLFKVYY